MKKNCFARMRSLFKASSGSDAPVVGASSSEKSLLRFKRLFFKPIDYESRATLYVNRTTKQKILEIVAKTGNSQLTFFSSILIHSAMRSISCIGSRMTITSSKYFLP